MVGIEIDVSSNLIVVPCFYYPAVRVDRVDLGVSDLGVVGEGQTQVALYVQSDSPSLQVLGRVWVGPGHGGSSRPSRGSIAMDGTTGHVIRNPPVLVRSN